MCKKLWILALMMSLVLCVSCENSYMQNKNMDVYEKIHRYYNQMESYSSKLLLTAYSNKTERTYLMEQKVICPDLYYVKTTDKTEHVSVVTTQKDGKTKTSFAGSGYAITVTDAEQTGMLFVNRFMKTYYGSEDTALFVGGMLQGNVTVLEVTLAENHLQMSRAEMSIDNKTLAPKEIVIKDADGDVVLKGVFEEFQHNDHIDPNIF